jgi:hypothetical protein
VHRLLYVFRRADQADFHLADRQAPLDGEGVQHALEVGGDLLAGHEAFVQRQVAEFLAQVGHGKLDDRPAPVVNVVERALDRILVGRGTHPHDAIDFDFDVILGDNRLGMDVHCVLAHIADADDMQERYL